MDFLLPVVLWVRPQRGPYTTQEETAMKKWTLRLLAGVLAVGLCTAGAYAYGGGWGAHRVPGTCTAQAYAGRDCRGDADGDGVCDLCGLPAGSGHSCVYQDADGDGICDTHAQSTGGHHGHWGGAGGCHRG